MSKQSHIHWQAPFLILGFLVTGVLLSVGHHLFYLSLDGSVVSAHGFKLFGSNHSQQQLDLAIGTTFSFLVRACFALSVSTAYYQIFWKMLRRATHDSKSARLDRIDDAFSATGNIVAMCNVPLWLTQPLLFLAASTAWYISSAVIRASTANYVQAVANSIRDNTRHPVCQFGKPRRRDNATCATARFYHTQFRLYHR